MKHVNRHFLTAFNLSATIPFLTVLSTVLIVNKDLANGIVSGKYFWFYSSVGLVSITCMLSFLVNRKRPEFSMLDLLVTGFCLSGLFVTYYHTGMVTGKMIILSLILTLYFFLKIFFVQYRRSFFILFVFFILTGLVEAVWGLRQIYGFLPSQHNLFKTTGSFFNSGPYGGYLAMILPAAFYYLLRDYPVFNKKFSRKYLFFYMRGGLSIAAFAGIIMVLPAVMSRASWIAAAGGCTVAGIGYLFRDKSRQKNVLTLLKRHKNKLIPIVLSFVILIALASAGMYRIKKDSADGRALIWKTALHVIAEHPWGVGLGHFPGAYGDKQAEYFASGNGSEQEQFVAGNPEYAFNEYLQICIEFGVIPFVVFFGMMVYAVRKGLKKKRYAPAGALTALLIFASMSYPFSVLPFVIALVFLLTSCSYDDRDAAIKAEGGCVQKLRGTGLLLTALSIIVAGCLYAGYPARDAYKKWSGIKMLYHSGLYREAAKGYEEQMPYLNREIQFLFEYARSLTASEQYEASNRVLEKAMKISCDPMLYNITGKNHQALGDYKMAEHYLIKSTLIVPSRLYPYYLLVKLYDETGEAEKVLQTAAIVQTKEAKVHSTAVKEMREEVKKICDKYESK